MINVKYFDVRCLFVSFLFLDVLKVEVWGYDVVKGVVNLVLGFGKKRVDVVGVFGFFKMLCELVRCLFIYYCVFLVEEVVYEEIKEIDDCCCYN